MNWIAWTAVVGGCLMGAFAGLTAYGKMRWAGVTEAKLAALDAIRKPFSAGLARNYDLREIANLPPPVQRYFRAVLTDGQPLIAVARFALTGKINMSADSSTSENWKPFTSTQQAVTRGPGFLWNGHVVMLPGVIAHVHDSFIAGVGALQAAVLGILTVASVQGGGEIARGELMRYFAEMPWYPTALLPSQGVRWTALDERSAHATLIDGPFALTLLFKFDDAGLIRSVHADARGSGVGKDMVMLPWDCGLSNYQMRHGMMVPTRGEAAKGGQAYFVGNLTSLAYDYVGP